MKNKLILSLIRLLSLLPLVIIRLLGLFMGFLLYYLPNKAARIAQINLQLCYPQKTTQQRNKILKKALQNNITTFMEFPKIWLGETLKWRKIIRHSDSVKIIDEKLALGKGLIIVAPHLGNWETGIDYLTTKAPVTGLYRAPRQKILENIMQQGRNKTGANFVPISQGGIKQIFQALKRGEIIIILPDQQPKEQNKSAAIFAPFFNQPALTMTLISRIAAKTQAPLVFASFHRLPAFKGFESHWFEAPNGVHERDILTAVTALNKGVEQAVNSCPEQYLWSYKRFDAQPNGQTPYKKAP